MLPRVGGGTDSATPLPMLHPDSPTQLLPLPNRREAHGANRLAYRFLPFSSVGRHC